jgi:hypothetical protein
MKTEAVKMIKITAPIDIPSPSRFAAIAATTPERHATEPTERSMPPVSIMNVIPVAIMEFMAICIETLLMFFGVAKVLFANASIAHMPIRNNSSVFFAKN